jgi:AcrR family transcriptional regulator
MPSEKDEWMPRQADHDARRRQITDAVRTVIVREGLGGVTFIRVSAEAGVSVRLIQYYFGDKESLLKAVLHAVITDSASRFPVPRSGRERESRDARRDLLLTLEALLPMTDAARADAIVLASFHFAALTTTEIDTRDTTDPLRALDAVIAPLLTDVASDPLTGSDVAAITDILITSTIGLTQSMLAGYKDPAAARDFLAALLSRLLPARG